MLILDTFEHARALDSWLRLEFLPLLDEAVRTVLASREPANSAWLSAPEWQGLFETMELRPLTLDECLVYLLDFGVSRDQAMAIGRAVRGHPLALTMTALLCAGRESAAVLDLASRSVSELAQRYLDLADSPASREVLEAACVIRRSTGALMHAMLPGTPSNVAMDSLR